MFLKSLWQRRKLQENKKDMTLTAHSPNSKTNTRTHRKLPRDSIKANMNRVLKVWRKRNLWPLLLLLFICYKRKKKERYYLASRLILAFQRVPAKSEFYLIHIHIYRASKAMKGGVRSRVHVIFTSSSPKNIVLDFCFLTQMMMTRTRRS